MSDADQAHADERDPAAELEALLSAAVDGIVTINHKGLIVGFNSAAESLFDYSTADVTGQPVDILMPEPYRSEHATYIERYHDTGERHIIGRGREVTGRKRDGTVFPIWISVGEAKTANGNLFVGIIRDLTEQRAAERKQRRLEARLAHVGRFSLMGEMAAGIAHEINQPLSAIANYAQAGKRLMDNEDFDADLLKESCDRISEQAHRAGAVIQNLRGFIAKQDVSMETVDINEAIRDVMGLIEVDTKAASIELKTEFAKNLPPVEANAVQLQQVVLNLTRNAVDAMRASLHHDKGIIIQTRLGDDGSLEVRVIDHGPGVSKSLREGIFHPFVTTKRDGLGVGLAISRTIVEAHEGRLSYQPNPDGGAIFVVSLPVKEVETN